MEAVGDLLKRLFGWAGGYSAHISKIQIEIEGASLRVILVQTGVRADFDLMDKLSEFDVEVAQDPRFEQLRMTTVLLPPFDPTVAPQIMQDLSS